MNIINYCVEMLYEILVKVLYAEDVKRNDKIC